MNKSELASRIAAEASLSRAAADRAVGATFSVIAETLAGGETVTIAGFGTFATRSRAARQGRNPATGEPIDIGGHHRTVVQGRQDPSPRREQPAYRVTRPLLAPIAYLAGPAVLVTLQSHRPSALPGVGARSRIPPLEDEEDGNGCD